MRKTKRPSTPSSPLMLMRFLGADATGTKFACSAENTHDSDKPFIVAKHKKPSLQKNALFLGALEAKRSNDSDQSVSVFRKLAPDETFISGIFSEDEDGGRILPIEKGKSPTIRISSENTNGAKTGNMVEAVVIIPSVHRNTIFARVTQVLDHSESPSLTSIAIRQHNIQNSFSAQALADANAAQSRPLHNHRDLVKIPFVTIDPSDARDHDDAVFAELDTDNSNAGGFIIWVAIADVAHYVTPGTELDSEAQSRGNSCYFPDCVVPMLPEQLSADLCSLHENVQRPCIVAKITISEDGKKLNQEFMRAIIKSRASLSYEEVQQAHDGTAISDRITPLLDTVISPLYQAYLALLNARKERQPLALDLPERKILLDEDNQISEIRTAERLTSHQLIEEFMVLANVAAAEELTKRNSAPLFRVHEAPTADKLESLRHAIKASGLTLPKTKSPTPKALNRLMEQASTNNSGELVSISVLRSMNQAYYHPKNLGHFGLALQSYIHFTSPIRRYADLLVHRALISSHNLGDDGLSTSETEALSDVAAHISTTERRAMLAERETSDRFIAHHLSNRLGETFSGQVAGVTNFGVFVRLDETGADGLVPIKSLSDEYFHYQNETQTLIGERSGLQVRSGLRVSVKLVEALPSNGAIALEMLEIDGKPLHRPKKRRLGANRSRRHKRR